MVWWSEWDCCERWLVGTGPWRVARAGWIQSIQAARHAKLLTLCMQVNINVTVCWCSICFRYYAQNCIMKYLVHHVNRPSYIRTYDNLIVYSILPFIIYSIGISLNQDLLFTLRTWISEPSCILLSSMQIQTIFCIFATHICNNLPIEVIKLFI